MNMLPLYHVLALLEKGIVVYPMHHKNVGEAVYLAKYLHSWRPRSYKRVNSTVESDAFLMVLLECISSRGYFRAIVG